MDAADSGIAFPENCEIKVLEVRLKFHYMDVADSVVGKVVLVSTATVFLLLAFWVNTYPFIDEESIIYEYIPAPRWFLLASGLWGLAFIGGLMAFSLYHLYPPRDVIRGVVATLN